MKTMDPSVDNGMLHHIWDMAVALLIFLLGLVGFNIKRTQNKVDEMQKEKADRDELKEAVARVEEAVYQAREENRQDHRDLHSRIDELHK
jgi:hypothetical protein